MKMVHNAVEYGLMQAYAEGFELMSASDKFNINLEQVAEIWRHGSVVRSWLLDLTTRALKDETGFGRHTGVRGRYGGGAVGSARVG